MGSPAGGIEGHRLHASLNMTTDRSDLFSRLTRRPDDLAIVASEGDFTFGQLTSAAARIAATLRGDRRDLEEARVAFLIPPGFRYAAVLLGIWEAGGVAVPLAVTHPEAELRYVVEDADAYLLIGSTEHEDSLQTIASERGISLLVAEDIVFGPATSARLRTLEEARRALILYTSGSTGRPKGVVWRHRNVLAQLGILSRAWGWENRDRALLVLPLHHVHGLINVLGCSLWSGATCEILPKFDPDLALDRLASGDVSVFMAVPTIYHRLIAAWEGRDTETRNRISSKLEHLRLMVSGSAALPVTTLEKWREISGHTLLERYGMTEIGMALSNSYEGTRIAGAVGAPLPTVEIKLVDDDRREVSPGAQGEIEVRGPSVFEEYWRRPQATAEAFRDGWFRTGDAAVEDGAVYRILGRLSVDIIKSGGEKVSALEVEDVLRAHPSVKDCAVVGIDDADWGELVAVAAVPEAGAVLDLEELRAYGGVLLAPHKLPKTLLVLDDLPRNALGKVVKPALKQMFD